MLKAISILLALIIAATAFTASPASDEAQIWNLEKAYWEYVKTNDLETYRALCTTTSSAGPLLVKRPFGEIKSPIGSRITLPKA